MMNGVGVASYFFIWLISLIPLLIALWAIISVVRSLGRMADAQEASLQALRRIADNMSAPAGPPA